MNFSSKIFDNYEVFWDEERGEIELWQKMQTNYDFNEANRATQQAINQVKAISNEGTQNEFDDEWSSAATNQNKAGGFSSSS